MRWVWQHFMEERKTVAREGGGEGKEGGGEGGGLLHTEGTSKAGGKRRKE